MGVPAPAPPSRGQHPQPATGWASPVSQGTWPQPGRQWLKPSCPPSLLDRSAAASRPACPACTTACHGPTWAVRRPACPASVVGVAGAPSAAWWAAAAAWLEAWAPDWEAGLEMGAGRQEAPPPRPHPPRAPPLPLWRRNPSPQWRWSPRWWRNPPSLTPPLPQAPPPLPLPPPRPWTPPLNDGPDQHRPTAFQDLLATAELSHTSEPKMRNTEYLAVAPTQLWLLWTNCQNAREKERTAQCGKSICVQTCRGSVCGYVLYNVCCVTTHDNCHGHGLLTICQPTRVLAWKSNVLSCDYNTSKKYLIPVLIFTFRQSKCKLERCSLTP